MLSVLLIRTASTAVAATSATQSSATTSNATGPTEGTPVYTEDSSPQGECTFFLLAYCGRHLNLNVNLRVKLIRRNHSKDASVICHK
jgi:hypothetical protein